ncbi:MAG TPA: 30S ribosomal protein S9 [Candidatus Saccharimonadia bacterium]|nr:30S ribosomal protein S9 [Candidatus Saccharimonadia bacterium]
MALKVKKSAPMKIRKVVKTPAVAGANGAVAAGAPVVARKSSGPHIYAVGRRKTASARVRLSRGGGAIMVNGRPATEYFKIVDPSGMLLNTPFKVIAQEGFTATVKVAGSGLKAQLEAVMHGVSRALVKVEAANKSPLRKAGLLTRDDRMKESRKFGTGGKARRKKQSPKR